MAPPPLEEKSPLPPGKEKLSDIPQDAKIPLAEVEDYDVSTATKSLNSWSDDIECVDVSDIVKSHADYPNQVGRILEFLKLEPCPMVVT